MPIVGIINGEFYLPGDKRIYFGDNNEYHILETANILYIESLTALPGVTGGIVHNLTITAGGAAAASIWGAVDSIDGQWESGLLAETAGGGAYQFPVFKSPYYSADYGGNHANLGNRPGAGDPAGIVNGCAYYSYDTDAVGGGVSAESAHFAYINGAWRKAVMT